MAEGKKCERKGGLKVKYVFWVLVTFLVMYAPVYSVFAEETGTVSEFMDGLDFEKVDEALHEGSGTDSFSFGGYVIDIVKGKQKLSFSSVTDMISKAFLSEFSGSLDILKKLLAILIISVIFTNFSYTLKSSHVAEMGFFVTYLLMIGILTASYMTAAGLAKEVVGSLLDFMKVMVPVYSMSIVFCGGGGSSAVFYQAVMALITLVDAVLLKILLPMIHLYFMAMLANYIMEEEILSKFAELIGTLVNWILKTILALVMGISTVQSLIAPAIDHVKSSAVLKWAAAIPGIGGLLGGVTETVLGAGSLLKNAIGTAGVIAVVVICALPLLKLAVYVLLYKLGAALMQPVADKRILSSVSACGEGTMMLLKTAFVGAVLFLIVIVMAAVSTTMYM